MNPNLSSALMYAHLNFKVFPLKVNSKSGQVLKSWLNEATTDVETIRNWFSNTDYNVGVRTGDGLVVIDIDNKNDKKGIDSIKPFLKGFPKTKVVKTPNNGWHMYYKVDKPIPNKTNLYEGIDVRGEHGYVVGIGSVIDGNSYFVSLDDPIADANDAVYQFLEGTKIKNRNNVDAGNVIEQGTRNDRLFRLGCALQSKGISDETIKMCLINENTLRCNPPLTEKEVNTIIQSIINRYDKTKEESVSEYQVTWKSALQMSQSPKVECTDIVENLLPIGVTLLAAPSKMGKTFLCMQMANAIAKGNEFLGFQCKQRNVYYIALEDPENNQIERLKNTIGEVADGYDIELTQPYQLDFSLEQKILNYKHFHSNLGVVIIDTFEKIRTNVDRTYTIEYKEVTEYHELGLKYNVAIILVMHTVKHINYNNVFANISGSAGTLAAADGLMVLLRNQLNRNIKMLYIDGKGIPADVIHTKQDETMTYIRMESDKENVDIDPDLLNIIHYVIENGKYIGACEKLAVGAGVTNCNGKHIRTLLDNHKQLLEQYFIRYKVPPRSSFSRKVELIFYGEDALDNDANDEYDAMTQK